MKHILYKGLTMLAGALMLGLAACTDAVPSEDFGPSPTVNTDGVFFYAASSTYKAKAKDDVLKLAVGRSKTASAQAYKLLAAVKDSAGNDASSNFVLPEMISFAAGAATDSISIEMRNLTYDMPYTVELSLSEGDATPYANSTQSFTITCEDPEAWQVVTDKAIFVNNIWSSLLSNATVAYSNITVKKYRGKNLFRIIGLPEVFRYEWTTIYQIAPDCEYTVENPETYAIEIDCETYSDPKARVKKLFMPFQSLGVKLNALEGSSWVAGEVWAGSVAYNLQNATTGEPLSEAKYPIGTYDTQTGVFKFGELATDFGDETLSIQLCRSETALYLDSTKMETNVRDLLYTNIRRATFKSTAYLDPNTGDHMVQGTKLGRCADEEYEDAQYTYRIASPYVANRDLFFTHKNGRVKFLDGQLTGSTALGGYPIFCEATSASYVKNDTVEKYVFDLLFYYTNDKQQRYDLGTFTEELELGSMITYFTADSLVRGKSIDDFVGTWQGEFVYVTDQNQTVMSNVTITKEDDYTLIVRGLAPYMEAQYGYDSSVYLDWNDETETFDFLPQYASTYNQYQINVYTANLDNPDSELYDRYGLRVGMLNDGRIAFVNNPDNAVEVNCAVYYTPASGGALVEPFIPYNLVLERVEESNSARFGSGIQTMIPWKNFGAVASRYHHANGKPSFVLGPTGTDTYKLLNLSGKSPFVLIK